MTERANLVYLDYAASTPVDPWVAEAMAALMTADGNYANPSSTHIAGRRSVEHIEHATGQLAGLLNTAPECLIWTSGATESDNLAILGAAHYRQDRGRHLVTMRTEHKAVTDPFKALQKQSFDVTWLDPEADGLLDLAKLKAALRSDTQLVSIMHVNNETGIIQDIRRIGELCREHGCLLHVDAAQSVGKLPIDLATLPLDLMSMTAHKVYGPKGIGALYIAPRPGVHVEPLLFGGGQQRKLRPGTLPAQQIVGFGAAAAIAQSRMSDDFRHLSAMRERLWSGIRDIPGISTNGAIESAFPGILNVSIEDIEGESLLLALEPLCVATGSACNSKTQEPSYVLRALGRSDELAQSAIRFSFGRPTRPQDIDLAIDLYRNAVARLRGMSPERAA
ncbi:MAG: aminotransferase class V-fold PLP-dependent enzyme [Gammaproteobacteria bacterium]|nr:aminotransferase class V-fold PLP-dependent enzyme [Gammaproteobacteria bacterium]MDH3430259.1 aminotransferase class V-fold PLP-dependent enzyme [Gammaproteobacteria bacterium]MDH3433004.1 aminotransferase class V-fold PLP-dependent enzyme [Gammaproteobacteria bacterium]